MLAYLSSKNICRQIADYYGKDGINMVKKIENNDMSEVLSSKYALVDFSAAWCGPCNMIGPVVEQLSEEKDDVEFFNVDVDKNPDLAMQYRIQSIPALVLFKDGKEANRSIGFIPKDKIEEFIS